MPSELAVGQVWEKQVVRGYGGLQTIRREIIEVRPNAGSPKFHGTVMYRENGGSRIITQYVAFWAWRRDAKLI